MVMVGVLFRCWSRSALAALLVSLGVVVTRTGIVLVAGLLILRPVMVTAIAVLVSCQCFGIMMPRVIDSVSQ